MKVVSIGAGTGQSNLLKSMKKHLVDIDLSAIVSVTDDGGHSGRLRRDLRDKGIPAPQIGDGRNCLIGLARNKEIASYFKVLPTGENSANTFIAGLLSHGCTLTEAFKIFGELVDAAGRVYPATDEDVEIVAAFRGDELVVGEWKIMEYNHTKELERLRLSSPVQANSEALKTLDQADYIIIGPGSFRTGIISALLPKGIKEKIMGSRATKVFVCNLFSQPGQTDGLTQVEYVNELIRYMGCLPNVILVNNMLIPDLVIEHYHQIKSYPIEDGNLDSLECRIVRTDLIPKLEDIQRTTPKQERIGTFKKWTHLLTHEREKLAMAIKSIINSDI